MLNPGVNMGSNASSAARESVGWVKMAWIVDPVDVARGQFNDCVLHDGVFLY